MTVPLEEGVPEGDAHRRRAGHLYGLIISGAVLATASDDFRLARVAVILLFTLTIYWAAESYVHWIAIRTHVQRDLTGAERRRVLSDGWPLVAASGVPLAFLAGAAVLGMETALALNLTLVVNAVMLFVAGWTMGVAGGITGIRLVLSAAATGLLGLALVSLKSLMH